MFNWFKKETKELKEYKLQFTRMETYEVEIVAYDEEEAYDIATSKRGEYLERKKISGKTIFDQDYVKENGEWQMV